jgi:hypothetical protein
MSTKFEEIVAFAEIEKFLGAPVKRYSSGMYARLAFAVAAHLEPKTCPEPVEGFCWWLRHSVSRTKMIPSR